PLLHDADKKGPLATASGPSLGRKRPRRAAVTRNATAPQQHTPQRTNGKGRGWDLNPYPGMGDLRDMQTAPTLEEPQWRSAPRAPVADDRPNPWALLSSVETGRRNHPMWRGLPSPPIDDPSAL